MNFSIYNKTNNTIVPSGIVVQAGKVGVCIDPGGTDRVIYWIDEYAGARTEISLYTEGQSAATYNLYDAVLDERVHGIRGFRCNLDTDFDYVFLEIDGQLYMPYASDDVAETLVNWNDDTFENAGDLEMAGFNTIVPKIAVEYSGESTVLRVPSFGNIEIAADELIEVTDAEKAIDAHVDGVIPTEFGWIACINGKYYALSNDGLHIVQFVDGLVNCAICGADNSGSSLITMYDTGFAKIVQEGLVFTNNNNLAAAKVAIAEDFGITLEEGYIPMVDGAADLTGPFALQV